MCLTCEIYREKWQKQHRIIDEVETNGRKSISENNKIFDKSIQDVNVTRKMKNFAGVENK